MSFTTHVAGELAREQENDLVVRCQNGDKSAMETLMCHYQHWVYNIAFGMLGNPEDASDMAQEIFLWLWQNVGQFQFRSRFSTWLYRVVTNRCINVKVQKKRRKTEPTEIDDSRPWVPVDTITPEQLLLDVEQREILEKALSRLRDDYRKIIILREMQDLSYEELAEVIGCSVGRVKSKLFEARKRLRKFVTELS